MVRWHGQFAIGMELTVESAAAGRTAAIDSINRGTFFARKEVAAAPNTLEEGVKRWATEIRLLRKTEDCSLRSNAAASYGDGTMTDEVPPNILFL